nr:hypothetical protein [Cellulomonas fimi]
MDVLVRHRVGHAAEPGQVDRTLGRPDRRDRGHGPPPLGDLDGLARLDGLDELAQVSLGLGTADDAVVLDGHVPCLVTREMVTTLLRWCP